MRAAVCGMPVWIIPSHAPIVISSSVLSRKIGDAFLEDLSSSVSLKDTVRSNWTNLALVNALIMTVAFTIWCLDVPGDDPHDLKVCWFGILTVGSVYFSSAGTILAAMSLVFTDGLSDEAVRSLLEDDSKGGSALIGYPFIFMCVALVELIMSLCLFTYVCYGYAAGTSTVVCAIVVVLFLIVNFKCLLSFSNDTDGKHAKLQDIAKAKLKLNHWWFYVCPHKPELDETLVPCEVAESNLIGECQTTNGQQFTRIALIGDDVLLVKRVDEHLRQLVSSRRFQLLGGDGIMDMGASLEKLQAMGTAEWEVLLEKGSLMPVPGKNSFLAITGENAIAWLTFSPDKPSEPSKPDHQEPAPIPSQPGCLLSADM